MMIRNSVAAIAFFVACLLPSGAAFAMGSDIAVRAGLARKTPQGGFVIYKDTTAIPFVPKSADPGYYFGVAASAASGQDLLCHVVLYLPNPNAVHGDGGDDVGAALISSVPYRVVTLEDVEVPVCQTYLRLDDNDVPGKYIVELFIGGELAQRVEFDVRRK
jgi:hypothetical protein